MLYLVPGDDFGAQTAEKKDVITFKDIFLYLKPYYPAIIHFFTGMLVASGISLVFPFLTQSIVDVGIHHVAARGTISAGFWADGE